MTEDQHNLLRPPSNSDWPSLNRLSTSYHPLNTFDLAKGDHKHYKQQYGDIYFLRLAVLKPVIEEIAADWEGFEMAGDVVHRVERVLDVRQGELCWVIGTVYMDMPLKPNILDDISKDHWITAPPPRAKYISPDGEDKIMLEDESGRLRLTGSYLQGEVLATGIIIAVMGTENANGDFEVMDIKFPDLPPQHERWAVDEALHGKTRRSTSQETSEGGKVAIVSGLDITGDAGDSLKLELFAEWLLGEAATNATQHRAAEISRLIIAGDSLSDAAAVGSDDAPTESSGGKRAAKKYGYDSSAYNPAPTAQLDLLLSTLLPSIPITLLPGASDPANVSLPQQPLHPALFPHSRAYAAPPTTQQSDPRHAGTDSDITWFHPTTNPSAFSLGGRHFLGTGGQPIDDIFKYVDSNDRLEMMEQTLRWRIVAPTCPDTLFCYPYQTKDPFVLDECPHVYFVGNQPSFETSLIEGPAGQQVRLVAVPKFSHTGQVVLVDLETLDVEIVQFDVLHEG